MTSLIKRLGVVISEVDARCRTCLCVLSHIDSSKANEAWLRDVIANTVEEVRDTSGQNLLDLIVVSRSRTGDYGKLSLATQVFPSAEHLIVDDNTEVVTEWIRRIQQAFHICLPKRDRSPLGRSYANIFEAESAITEWIDPSRLTCTPRVAGRAAFSANTVSTAVTTKHFRLREKGVLSCCQALPSFFRHVFPF